MFLSKHLINMKSILLFITISDENLNAVLKSPEDCAWINTLRLLRPKNKFEIRCGLPRIHEEKKKFERNEEHFDKEKRLEDLLKSEGVEKDSEKRGIKVNGKNEAC